MSEQTDSSDPGDGSRRPQGDGKGGLCPTPDPGPRYALRDTFGPGPLLRPQDSSSDTWAVRRLTLPSRGPAVVGSLTLPDVDGAAGFLREEPVLPSVLVVTRRGATVHPDVPERSRPWSSDQTKAQGTKRTLGQDENMDRFRPCTGVPVYSVETDYWDLRIL